MVIRFWIADCGLETKLERLNHLFDFFHGNIEVGSIVDALAIFYQQNLRGFVVDLKTFGYFIGHSAVADQIKVIRFDLRSLKIPLRLQAVFGDGTDVATCAVLENQAGNLVGTFGDLGKLFGSGKLIPIHF
jgi:hypothetical protein